ncbi:MAG: MarR family transcriptional regulator [Tissierellia bacterium]|nr:MarR family transcriptional regulator [Tissierellia bacterium]
MDEITSKQWFVLGVLEYFEDFPTLKELSHQLGYSHQNTKQLLNKLEEKGFVRFEEDPIDKRSIRIRGTDKIKEWEERNAENAQMFIEMLFDGISNEYIEIVSDVLNEFYKRLDKIYEKN